MISKLLCTDVLAIRCIGNRIFLGIGSILYVFKKSVTYELELKVNCLYPNNIHGIIDGPDNSLVVFGVKSICIYDIITKEDKMILKQRFDTCHFNDWIIAVRWLTVINEYRVLAILFAHNYVCIYDACNKERRYVFCEEACILYGGSMSGTTSKDLVIFSGTVFQEILIWKAEYNSVCNKRAAVLHRLAGHNGVIFSVVYDPCTHFICSTSDDRTVRLWKITSDSLDSEVDSLHRKDDYVDWQKGQVKLVKTMFGHAARVWRAIIRNNTIFTIGEDSLVCMWSLSGKLLNKIFGHQGAAIWSIDISEDNENIYTGGADGAVYKWPCTCDNTPKIIPIPIRKDIPKYVAYLISGTLLVFNEGGILLSYNENDNVARESLYLEKYNTYCIMQVSPCRNYVIFASREGDITMFTEIRDLNNKHLEQVLEHKVMESKIFSLHWIEDNTIVVCGINGMLRVINIMADNTLCIRSEKILPLSKERWVTSATAYKDLLICGDRMGNLHVFKLNNNLVNNETEINASIKMPIQTLNKVHGRIGIQSCTITENKLMTTGRDGSIKFYEICENKLLSILYKKKMPMDWISGILKVPNDVFIMGFKEIEFMIYSMSLQRICLQIRCGGGHRSWDCIILDNFVKFTYIRNKHVYIFNYLLHFLSPPLHVVLNGFHLKEIYSLKTIANSTSHKIYISGGEDCKLRVSCVNDSISSKENYIFQTVVSLDGHISHIKSIVITELENTALHSAYLVFSGGGRAQIKVWKIDIKWHKDVLHREDINCKDLNAHMLYGRDQYRRKHWQRSKEGYTVEPETRYMDINVYYPCHKSNCILLFVACADGYLRIFTYNIITNNIRLMISNKCTTHCILKIHTFLHGDRIIVLTMATDGVIRYFDFTDIIFKICSNTHHDSEKIEIYRFTSFATLNMHQSGINCYDFQTINDNRYLLITGGDDNLLSLTLFKICTLENSKELFLIILSNWSNASVHSAQITGVKFDGEKIYSVGMDQQVITHTYSCNNNVINVKLVSSIFTSISDAQGLVLYPSMKNTDVFACIYGKGLEIISIQDNNI